MVTAGPGEEAVLKISERRPDVIVLDIMLPGLKSTAGGQISLRAEEGRKVIRLVVINQGAGTGPPHLS